MIRTSMIFLFVIVSFQINYSLSQKYYTIDEIYQIFDDLKTNEKDLEVIVDCLSSTFSEAYAYNQIAKNPPQPDFNSSYHEKVDIQNELKNINLKNVSMYKFYQDIKLLFDRLGDQHLGINIKNFIVTNMHFSDPLKLNIKEYDNKTRMFAESKVSSYEEKYYRNYETIFNIIKNNVDVPITTINGKDPFDYITYFGGDYEKLKSPQGSFRLKLFEHNGDFDFFEYPVNKSDLINFTVVYDNGDNFTTDFIAWSGLKIDSNQINDNFKAFVDNIKKNKETNDKLNKKNIVNDILIFRSDKILKKLSANDKFEPEKKVKSLNAGKDWDVNYSNVLACRVDNDKKLNIYGLVSFGGVASMDFIDTIKKCTKLFDENTYPIVLANILNGGGLVTNSHYLLETLSPTVELNIYGRMRNTAIIKDNQIIKSIFNSLSDIDDCDPLSYSQLKKTKKSVDYGDSITDSLIGPFLFTGRDFREHLNKFKSTLKRPRKPTEILVYTDGFSYSATALLLKYLQYHGGAITAGYFTNPNLDDVPFDSSLSPSSVFSGDIVSSLGPEGYNTLNKNYGYSISLAGMHSFYTANDYKIPLEYVVTPVDERVNIYINRIFKSSYDMIDARNFDVFLDNALEIFEKYKKYCNPKNKKLLLVSSECDGSFGEHTHGGYECGDNGEWSKKCVASYCDIGYIFDYDKKKCIENVCLIGDVESKLFIVILIIFIIIFALFATLCICVKIRKRNKERRYKENTVEKMNLDEKLN